MNVLELFHAIAGDRRRPPGAPLVHVRCSRNCKVATIEEANGQPHPRDNACGLSVQTWWRSRRFPGVPNLECPQHGLLDIDKEKLKAKLHDARRARVPRTLKARRVS